MATYTTAWLDFQSLSQSGDGDGWVTDAWEDAGPNYEQATAFGAKATSSKLLYISNIDYPTLDPADTLVGIEFRFTREGTAAQAFIDEIIRLSVAGSQNLAKTDPWPEEPGEVASYGGTDTLWGASVTTADLNGAFGIEIQGVNTSSVEQSAGEQSNAQIRFTFEEASSGLIANLDVQETGSDTASVSLGVVVSGSISVQETGQDVASGSLGVVVSSALTAQEVGQDVFSGAAAIAVTGNLSAQEAVQDAASGTLGVSVSVSLTAQEAGADTFTATATLGPAPITATLAAQEIGADTLSGMASVIVLGSLTAQETGQDVFSGAAAVGITATLNAQEIGSDTFAGMAFTIQPSARRFAFPNEGQGGSVTTQARPAIISQARAGVVLSQNNGGQILDHARSGHIIIGA